jgi:multidrug efflux pump subunit AcrA (membrane-fusion protein)
MTKITDLELPDVKSFTNYAEEMVGVGDVVRSITYTGQVVSDDDIFKTVSIPDKNIDELPVKVGQSIKKGARISKISQRFTAPFSGKIGSITKSENGFEITLVNYDGLYIETKIKQQDLSKLEIGKSTVVIYNGAEFSGTVSYVDYQVVDGMISVHIAYDDEKITILPGSEISVKLIEDEKKGVLCIGKNALTKITESQYFAQMYDENGNIITVNIDVGLVGDTNIEIVSGLNEGDSVIYPLNRETDIINGEESQEHN